ncbi:MAG: ABC transporter ATP-binding protein [Desulfuromonadales bacterium]|nr:ABC transporter ATP-binding protein [Desulfuromonadales bacterium]NIS43186.1 ABC transporter ATP-binding protein [Desulfuromonadales bacterium]
MKPLLEVKNLTKTFQVSGSAPGSKKQTLHAVDDISFSLTPGETFGLVGESGCGKSTTGKLLLRLLDADSGAIIFNGQNLGSLSEAAIRPLRRQIQMIFQDPFSSLNPRMRVGQIIAEPLKIHGLVENGTMQKELERLLEIVGLEPSYLDRFPHEFSGGQRQRIGIARALAVRPQLIIADEPVSALDVSIQAQVINLLQDIQTELGLTYLFIAHDLAVIEHICDRVAVMYLGRIVEMAPAESIYRAPQHPYTEALLASVPVPDPRQVVSSHPLEGEVPSPINRPAGCHFHPRCRYARDICRTAAPPLESSDNEHYSACYFKDEVGK